ncbi:hypothetical protein GN956_G18117 [Arapaima gigas]
MTCRGKYNTSSELAEVMQLLRELRSTSGVKKCVKHGAECRKVPESRRAESLKRRKDLSAVAERCVRTESPGSPTDQGVRQSWAGYASGTGDHFEARVLHTEQVEADVSLK